MKKVIYLFLIIFAFAMLAISLSSWQKTAKPLKINGPSKSSDITWISNNEIIVLSKDSSTGVWLSNIEITNKKSKILRSRLIAPPAEIDKYSILSYDSSRDILFLARKEEPGKAITSMNIATLSGTGNDTSLKECWYSSPNEKIEGISNDGNYLANSIYNQNQFSGISIRDIQKDKDIYSLRLVDYRGGSFDKTGQYFVFIGNTEKTYKTYLYLIDLANNTLRKYPSNIERAYNPVFDSEKGFIYFPQPYHENIRIIQLSSKTGKTLKSIKYNSNMGIPRISPASQWILYLNDWQIYMIPAFK